MPAGLYVHVPFCRSKCGYCDFYSVPLDEDARAGYLRAILAELDARSDDWRDTVFGTIYFGGGTPSILSAGELDRILERVHGRYRVQASETTLECNPGTVDERYFRDIRKLGVNRVSLGVQSLDDASLRLLGRIHNSAEAFQAFQAARKAGMEQVGLDLIYGIPGQSLRDWASDLALALSQGPDHLSLYELTLEAGTPMAGRAGSGELLLPPETEVEEMYRRSVDLCADRGLQWYEISNFSRPGCECRHNLNYWARGEYAGFGPSAHSFQKERRSWNPSSLKEYAEAVSAGRLGESRGGETIDPGAACFERMMLGLRTRAGIPESEVPSALEGILEEFLRSGHLERVEDRVRLTMRGVLLSNEVFAKLR